ncbi:MAG: YicC/YloC family endoribonuclease [Bacteroidia bacterium]
MQHTKKTAKYYIWQLMIKSMTGFGQAVNESEKLTCKAEIKSVNNKFLEINIRLPKQWQSKETDLRRQLTKTIERGTVVLTVSVQYKQINDLTFPLNKQVASYYINQLTQIANENNTDVKYLFRSVFEFPNIINQTEETTDEGEWQFIHQTILQACKAFDEYRTIEGKQLEEELLKYCNSINQKNEELILLEPNRLENIKIKLLKELEQLKNDIADKNRFEQELIYYLEKLDISEEKQRLNQHCTYFTETIRQPSNGKKLGFIAQEMGREINTIGSKSYNADMQRKVVEMKDELEKIKEQLNNVL